MLPTLLNDVAAQCSGMIAASQAADTPSAELPAQVIIRGVVTDNRAVKEGDLFVAIAGERVDGNTFAGDALKRGAAGVMTEDASAALAAGADPQRLIVVDNVYAALGNLAREQLKLVRKHGRKDFTVIAVTGSVGKTTTKDLLGALLAQRGSAIVPPGSFNNELGLPLTVLRADETTATLILEMGAGARGDLAYLTSIAPPDISIVLIVARAHLGFMGGIEAVAKAKQELVEHTREGGIVVLNADDKRVTAMSLAAPARTRVKYFSAHTQALPSETESIHSGIEQHADLYASDITLDTEGHASFTLHAPNGNTSVTLALVGEHHVTNALAAASVAYELGVSLSEIARILNQTGPISEHRMNVTKHHDVTLIDDSYNANPDSVRAGIDAAVHIAAGRRVVAVLGQMAELGEVSAQEHLALGEYASAAGIDRLVAVGDGVENLIEGAREAGIAEAEHICLDEAARFVQSIIASGDVILVKGSHSSGVWCVADALHEWLSDPNVHLRERS